MPVLLSPTGYAWVYTCACIPVNANMTSVRDAVDMCNGMQQCAGVLRSCDPLLDSAIPCHELRCGSNVTDQCLFRPTVATSFSWTTATAACLQIVALLLLLHARKELHETLDANIVRAILAKTKPSYKHVDRDASSRQPGVKLSGARSRSQSLAAEGTSSVPGDHSSTAEEADARWWWLRLARTAVQRIVRARAQVSASLSSSSHPGARELAAADERGTVISQQKIETDSDARWWWLHWIQGHLARDAHDRIRQPVPRRGVRPPIGVVSPFLDAVSQTPTTAIRDTSTARERIAAESDQVLNAHRFPGQRLEKRWVVSLQDGRRTPNHRELDVHTETSLVRFDSGTARSQGERNPEYSVLASHAGKSSHGAGQRHNQEHQTELHAGRTVVRANDGQTHSKRVSSASEPDKEVHMGKEVRSE